MIKEISGYFLTKSIEIIIIIGYYRARLTRDISKC